MICAVHQTFFRWPITENELGWACGTHDKRKAYKVLVWKPEETGREGVQRNNLDLDRYKQQALAHLLMNFQVLHIVENFSTVWGTGRFSRMTLLHGVSYHRNSAKVYLLKYKYLPHSLYHTGLTVYLLQIHIHFWRACHTVYASILLTVVHTILENIPNKKSTLEWDPQLYILNQWLVRVIFEEISCLM
jgi:hypothetical protein